MHRYVEAKRLSGLQIDYQLEFHRSFDRQVRRLGTLENSPRVDADQAIHVRLVGSIAHQTAGCDELACRVARGNGVARRPWPQLFAPAEEEHVRADQQRGDSLLDQGGHSRVDFALGAGLCYDQFSSEGSRCRCASFVSASALGLFGSTSMPNAAVPGASSLSNSSLF